MCSFLEMMSFCAIARINPQLLYSTTESEYMITSQSTKKTNWFCKLVGDVRCVQIDATTIMCENQVCIALAKNPTHHSRTKHHHIQHHVICEKLESREIRLRYCPTEYMVADVLTKAFLKKRHNRSAKSMGLRKNNYSQSESVGVYVARN